MIGKKRTAAEHRAGGSGIDREEEGENADDDDDDGMRYFAQKRRKIREQFLASGAEKPVSNLLGRVCVYVNGRTDPPFVELKRLLFLHGGRFEMMFSRSEVTHVIASNLPGAKTVHFEMGPKSTPVVTPAWLVDSCRAGRLLPVSDYSLSCVRPVGQQTLQIPQTPGPRAAVVVVPETPAQAAVQAGARVATVLVPETPCAAGRESIDNGNEDKDGDERQDFEDDDGVDEVPGTPEEQEGGPDSDARAAATGAAAARGVANLHTMHPDFIEHYFGRSRLHFIGSWRKRLVTLVPQLLRETTPRYPLPGPVGPDQRRVVVHVDMDCYFASVALLSRPDLVGHPVAVAHGGGHKSYGAEISSCNYPARAFGLRAGMWMDEARKLCPELVVLPYEFDKYERTSEEIYRVFFSFTHAVQPVSCDEVLLEFPPGTDARSACEELRREVRARTGCAASAGCAENIMLARLATRRAKPDGLVVLELSSAAADPVAREAQLASLLDPLGVSELPGVGWTTDRRLRAMVPPVRTVGDLRRLPLAALAGELGPRAARALFDFARGVDPRTIQEASAQPALRSVGAEVNWGIRIDTRDDVLVFLGRLCDEVQRRLDSVDCRGRTATLKLMVRAPDVPVQTRKFLGHGKCVNLSRSAALPRPADLAPAIRRLFLQLEVAPQDVRGIGISVGRLEPNEPPPGRPLWQTAVAASSSSSCSSVAAPAARARVVVRAAAPAAAPSVELPPLSQLDREVVAELPRSIREELAAAYKHRQQQQQQPPQQRRQPPVRSATAPPSRAPHPTTATATATSSSSSSSFSSSLLVLPSPTQIDMSVVRDLPPDVRRDVEAGIRERRRLRGTLLHYMKKPAEAATVAKVAGPVRERVEEEEKGNDDNDDDDDVEVWVDLEEATRADVGDESQGANADPTEVFLRVVASPDSGRAVASVGRWIESALARILSGGPARGLEQAMLLLRAFRRAAAGRGSPAWAGEFNRVMETAQQRVAAARGGARLALLPLLLL